MFFGTKKNGFKIYTLICLVCLVVIVSPIQTSEASPSVATTTLELGICGNGIVEGNEECDVPGQTGEYSTTIAGRQCTEQCTFGPYCGDGILQTQFGEECDDGTNTDDNFCTADCQLIFAGVGGGGSSGGGGGGGGGGRVELGETQIRVVGTAYPNTTINFVLDTENIGTTRTSGTGRFEFLTAAAPGTATLGIWANDSARNRSITFNTTFDVTQGAITNVDNVVLPPTISVSNQNPSTGDMVTISGFSVPGATIEIHLGNDGVFDTVVSNSSGRWSYDLDTGTLPPREYTIRARSVTGTLPLTIQSNFSSSIQLFAGVDGSAITPSDLNRDGRVNLIDFSILIFWWNTNGGDSDPPADINGDGIVNLADFSILLFNWTG